MGSNKYGYTEGWDSYELPDELKWHKTYDGIFVTQGSVFGSGFEPNGRGITIPGHINGETVTELNGTYFADQVEYIEGFTLKRISLTLLSHYEPLPMLCSEPLLCGKCQDTLESFDLKFCAPKMHFGHFSNSKLTHVSFVGKVLANSVLDPEDWDYTWFPQDLFAGCTELKSVTGFFEGDILDSGCFYGCSSLVTLPTLKVSQMWDYTFADCKSLSHIHLSDGLKSLGSGIFENCTSLTDLYIPDTVESIGSGIFNGCTSLKSVHIPKNISIFPSETFQNCHELQKIFVPDALNKIGDRAFYGCEKLKSPWLPDGLTSIGKEAFYGCKSIREIWIPKNVTSIGENAFGGCAELLIKCPSNSVAEQYAKENGIRFLST